MPTLKFKSVKIPAGGICFVEIIATHHMRSRVYLSIDETFESLAKLSLSSFRINEREQLATSVEAWLGMFHRPQHPIMVDGISKGDKILLCFLNCDNKAHDEISGRIVDSLIELEADHANA